MEISVKLFGVLAEIAGKNELVIVDARDTDTLEASLLNLFPEFREQRYVVAVSNVLSADNRILQPGECVALLPPFAGG